MSTLSVLYTVQSLNCCMFILYGQRQKYTRIAIFFTTKRTKSNEQDGSTTIGIKVNNPSLHREQKPADIEHLYSAGKMFVIMYQFSSCCLIAQTEVKASVQHFPGLQADFHSYYTKHKRHQQMILCLFTYVVFLLCTC